MAAGEAETLSFRRVPTYVIASWKPCQFELKGMTGLWLIMLRPQQVENVLTWWFSFCCCSCWSASVSGQRGRGIGVNCFLWSLKVSIPLWKKTPRHFAVAPPGTREQRHGDPPVQHHVLQGAADKTALSASMATTPLQTAKTPRPLKSNESSKRGPPKVAPQGQGAVDEAATHGSEDYRRLVFADAH